MSSLLSETYNAAFLQEIVANLTEIRNKHGICAKIQENVGAHYPCLINFTKLDDTTSVAGLW
jgi:hypothetical protein